MATAPHEAGPTQDCSTTQQPNPDPAFPSPRPIVGAFPLRPQHASDLRIANSPRSSGPRAIHTNGDSAGLEVSLASADPAEKRGPESATQVEGPRDEAGKQQQQRTLPKEWTFQQLLGEKGFMQAMMKMASRGGSNIEGAYANANSNALFKAGLPTAQKQIARLPSHLSSDGRLPPSSAHRVFKDYHDWCTSNAICSLPILGSAVVIYLNSSPPKGRSFRVVVLDAYRRVTSESFKGTEDEAAWDEETRSSWRAMVTQAQWPLGEWRSLRELLRMPLKPDGNISSSMISSFPAKSSVPPPAPTATASASMPTSTFASTSTSAQNPPQPFENPSATASSVPVPAPSPQPFSTASCPDAQGMSEKALGKRRAVETEPESEVGTKSKKKKAKVLTQDERDERAFWKASARLRNALARLYVARGMHLEPGQAGGMGGSVAGLEQVEVAFAGSETPPVPVSSISQFSVEARAIAERQKLAVGEGQDSATRPQLSTPPTPAPRSQPPPAPRQYPRPFGDYTPGIIPLDFTPTLQIYAPIDHSTFPIATTLTSLPTYVPPSGLTFTASPRQFLPYPQCLGPLSQQHVANSFQRVQRTRLAATVAVPGRVAVPTTAASVMVPPLASTSTLFIPSSSTSSLPALLVPSPSSPRLAVSAVEQDHSHSHSPSISGSECALQPKPAKTSGDAGGPLAGSGAPSSRRGVVVPTIAVVAPDIHGTFPAVAVNNQGASTTSAPRQAIFAHSASTPLSSSLIPPVGVSASTLPVASASITRSRSPSQSRVPSSGPGVHPLAQLCATGTQEQRREARIRWAGETSPSLGPVPLPLSTSADVVTAPTPGPATLSSLTTTTPEPSPPAPAPMMDDSRRPETTTAGPAPRAPTPTALPSPVPSPASIPIAASPAPTSAFLPILAASSVKPTATGVKALASLPPPSPAVVRQPSPAPATALLPLSSATSAPLGSPSAPPPLASPAPPPSSASATPTGSSMARAPSLMGSPKVTKDARPLPVNGKAVATANATVEGISNAGGAGAKSKAGDSTTKEGYGVETGPGRPGASSTSKGPAQAGASTVSRDVATAAAKKSAASRPGLSPLSTDSKTSSQAGAVAGLPASKDAAKSIAKVPRKPAAVASNVVGGASTKTPLWIPAPSLVPAPVPPRASSTSKLPPSPVAPRATPVPLGPPQQPLRPPGVAIGVPRGLPRPRPTGVAIDAPKETPRPRPTGVPIGLPQQPPTHRPLPSSTSAPGPSSTPRAATTPFPPPTPDGPSATSSFRPSETARPPSSSASSTAVPSGASTSGAAVGSSEVGRSFSAAPETKESRKRRAGGPGAVPLRFQRASTVFAPFGSRSK